MATTTPSPKDQSQHGLPSITTLTSTLSTNFPTDSQSQLGRDSRAWPGSLSSSNINTNNNNNNNGAANSSLQVHTLLNHDDGPLRSSVPNTPQSARGLTPATAQLPSINSGFHDAGNRDSQLSMDSRRSSVDSRMNSHFNGLQLGNPTSPYESANTSQVSLASLRRPSGIPLSPFGARNGARPHPAPRIAPPIMPVGRVPGGPDPTAARPTQGYAWAFPDQAIPEERRDSESGDSSTNGISRTNSLAASSIRSSILSTDHGMPLGQRRFDEDHGTTHHHSMQHRSIQSLQAESIASPQGVGNYSRTPELRISHKLAERKRRSEMKDLFDDLNKAVPTHTGSKASKWEILTKAIEFIRQTQSREVDFRNEVEKLQHDSEHVHIIRAENDKLRQELQLLYQNVCHIDPHGSHIYGDYTRRLASQMHAGHANGAPILPPLSNGPPNSAYNNPSSQAPMQGVEYGNYGR